MTHLTDNVMKAYKIPTVKLYYVGDSGAELPIIRSSADTAKILRETYNDGEIELQEYFKVAYLNQANRLIGVHTVSMGGFASTVVDSRILFTGALLARASAIILCHNHPSGNTRPSGLDDQLTRKLRDGGELLNIRVIDHVILTSDSYYSYADEGKI